MPQSSFLESYPNAGGIRLENRDGVIWVSLTDIGRACGKFFLGMERTGIHKKVPEQLRV